MSARERALMHVVEAWPGERCPFLLSLPPVASDQVTPKFLRAGEFWSCPLYAVSTPERVLSPEWAVSTLELGRQVVSAGELLPRP